MGLHIESGPLKVERLNHPDDIYIYFEVGYTVWNYTRSEPLGIWWEHNGRSLRGYLQLDLESDGRKVPSRGSKLWWVGSFPYGFAPQVDTGIGSKVHLRSFLPTIWGYKQPFSKEIYLWTMFHSHSFWCPCPGTTSSWFAIPMDGSSYEKGW
jgi:hypothetical protein